MKGFEEQLFTEENDPTLVEQKLKDIQGKIESNNQQIELGNNIQENQEENADLEKQAEELQKKLDEMSSAV